MRGQDAADDDEGPFGLDGQVGGLATLCRQLLEEGLGHALEFRLGLRQVAQRDQRRSQVVVARVGIEDQKALRLHGAGHAIRGRFVELGGPGQIVEAPLGMIHVEESEHPKTPAKCPHDELVIGRTGAKLIALWVLPPPSPGCGVVCHRYLSLPLPGRGIFTLHGKYCLA